MNHGKWYQWISRVKFQTALISFTALIMSVAIIGSSVTTYQMFQRSMIERVASSRIDVLMQVAAKVESVQDTMRVISNLYDSPAVTDALSGHPDAGEGHDRKRMERLDALDALYKNSMRAVDLPYYFTLIGKNGFHYISPEAGRAYDFDYAESQLWYSRIPQNEPGIFWTQAHKEGPDGQAHVVSAARSVMKGGESLGMLLINLPERALYDTYRNILNHNSMYIVEPTGRIVSQNDERMVGLTYFNMKRLNTMVKSGEYTIIKKLDKEYLLSRYDEPNYDWILVEEVPMEDLMLPMREIQNGVLLVTVITILVAVGSVYILVRKTQKPLLQLCGRLQRVSEGDFHTEFDITGWWEITHISHVSAQMARRIGELVDSVKKEEELKRHMELDLLQTQINPHFMYNTLFSIKCMIGLGETEKADEMTGAFITMLRTVLDNKDELITLESELESLRQYVLILKYRYGEGFTVRYDMEEELLQAKVLRFILQPIVENCVLHGIEPSDRSGLVEIRSSGQENGLQIRISDNGAGMSRERLEEVRQSLSSRNGKNIGIVNVHQRIRLHFGEPYGLEINSREREGTSITIDLPLL